MRKFCIAIFVCTIMFVQTAALAGQLSAALEQYKMRVNAVLSGTQDEMVREYVQTCLTSADQLNGLEAEDPRVYDAFKAMVAFRSKADDLLTSRISGDPAVRKETAAYNEYLQPYLKEKYIGLIKLQDELLERKYFKTEIAGNANFIEGYINGHIGFTRTDNGNPSEVLDKPTLGVSPWEAIFRFEPALLLNRSQQMPIFGTAGLSYTFFPSIDRSKTPRSFDESFWSKYIQKSGARLGVGFGKNDNNMRLLLGAGVQINIFALWAIYEPDNYDSMIGFGTSNLSILDNFLPWFE
jgi:hypothetical protein